MEKTIDFAKEWKQEIIWILGIAIVGCYFIFVLPQIKKISKEEAEKTKTEMMHEQELEKIKTQKEQEIIRMEMKRLDNEKILMMNALAEKIDGFDDAVKAVEDKVNEHEKEINKFKQETKTEIKEIKTSLGW